MSLAQVASEHRRLAILRALTDSPEYTSNLSVMTDLVNGFGVPSSRDQVDGDASWLAEQGLIERKDHAGFIILQARERGIDVASGRSAIAGVRRPSARS